MSRRVAILKGAPPRAKYQYMNMVLDLRDTLRDEQDKPKETCPKCGGSMEGRPSFMTGKYDICYGCWYEEYRASLPD